MQSSMSATLTAPPKPRRRKPARHTLGGLFRVEAGGCRDFPARPQARRWRRGAGRSRRHAPARVGLIHPGREKPTSKPAEIANNRLKSYRANSCQLRTNRISNATFPKSYKWLLLCSVALPNLFRHKSSISSDIRRKVTK